MEAQAAYSHFPILNCGVDWLTCTSKTRGVSNALEDWGIEQLHKENAGDGRVSPAKRLGYVGLSTSGLFVGRRPDSVLLQLSGPRCAPLATQAIRLSSNVSRIDLQVTVWTEGEQCHLARWTRDQLLRQQREGRRRLNFALIEGHPDGETLSLGKRISDAYARLYDKTAEARLGPPRLLWRYEVELKRSRAQQVARGLAEEQCNPQRVCKLVHAWYTMKGVEPSFTTSSCRNAFDPIQIGADRDVLTWFAKSLSITIKTAIAKHGLPAVLSALGLSNLLQGSAANDGPRDEHNALSAYHDDEPTRSDMPERVLLHQSRNLGHVDRSAPQRGERINR